MLLEGGAVGGEQGAGWGGAKQQGGLGINYDNYDRVQLCAEVCVVVPSLGFSNGCVLHGCGGSHLGYPFGALLVRGGGVARRGSRAARLLGSKTFINAP